MRKMIQYFHSNRYILTLSSDTMQIAVKEAIPFQEFKFNPFTVLCTTTLGGHLSWFETGGGRWFSKPVRRSTETSRLGYTDQPQVTQFLMRMANEVDLSRLTRDLERRPRDKSMLEMKCPDFNPMRRKLDVRF